MMKNLGSLKKLINYCVFNIYFFFNKYINYVGIAKIEVKNKIDFLKKNVYTI